MQITRFFTSETNDIYDSFSFVSREIDTTDGQQKLILVPEDWSIEAAQTFSDAFCKNISEKLSPIEENILPSWMWRHRQAGARNSQETDARTVFNRIAGSAAYAGWKSGLLNTESDASVFYDEIRFMLAQRIIALDPLQMNRIGLSWAYDIAKESKSSFSTEKTEDLSNLGVHLENAAIDKILSGNETFASKKWEKLLRKDNDYDTMNIKFVDTEYEWGAKSQTNKTPRITLDLLSFHREDMPVDVSALQQATLLSVLLLELHYETISGSDSPSRSIAIGHVNLSALLMAEAILYGSAAGRSTAAAISAIITAEATATSAELANIYGFCKGFSEHRELKLRTLRNQRRAAYGERNDYERVSIIPAPLDIEAGADLVLVATARRRWDEALDLVQKHGLRHLQHTELRYLPFLPSFLECSAQGIEPEINLVRQRALSPDIFKRELHPAASLSLKKLKCDPSDIKAIENYAVGHNTLVAAPCINHFVLSKHRLDESALSRIESYLPKVNDIRFAFTPWVIGERFCHQTLRVPLKQLHDASFCLLKHLGFSEDDIASANAFCCGHGTVIGAHELPHEAEKLFAACEPRQQISMAAAVQSFVSSDINLIVSLPTNETIENQANIILSAWRQGVKSITLYFEGAMKWKNSNAKPLSAMPRKKLFKRKSTISHAVTAILSGRRKTSAMMTSPQHRKPKASTQSTSISQKAIKRQPRTIEKTKH